MPLVPSPELSLSDADVAETSVLLVDDEENIRFLARLQLERGGSFEVVGEAHDGLEAIELAGRLQPSVILLDVMMPRMDGFTALPELLTTAPRSMIVMLSSLSASQNTQPALAAGAFAYLEKADLAEGLTDRLTEMHVRFRRALAGETVWAPEHPPRVLG